MQEFILSLQAAQLESVPLNDITNLLVLFQKNINAKFFVKSNDIRIEEVFKEIWKFFLFAANHSASSVRLSSYRATGAFLLKMSPYYTYIVQKSFSDISMIATIDIKSSAIIASSFAFISSRIALPYLDEFLNSTPVFHHFAVSDPIFSQNLSSIIANLGELGFDWFSTLLHSLLNLPNSSHDRHLMKSITAVILHDPINLMNDFLQFNKDMNSYQKLLQLSAYILTTGHVYDDSFDLFGLSKASIDILKHPNDFNSTEIDSAFQILSIKSPSFYLQVESAGQESVTLTLHKKKPDDTMDLIDFGFNDSTSQSSEQISIVIKVSTFLVRPTIFLLDLPVLFSEPQQTDGSLTLAAKFKSLANRINIYPEKTSVVLATFLKYYNKKYDNVASAILQGIAECVPTLIKFADMSTLIPLLESAIFTEQTSWFHLSDILSIVEKIPFTSYEKLFGPTGLKRIATLLINSCMSPNEKIGIRSSEILRKTVTSQNFHELTLLIISSIDIFDDDNLSHLLPVFSDIINDHKDENMDHLHYLIIQLVELNNYYSNNLPVLVSLHTLLSHFALDFVPKQIIHPAYIQARTIIAASIQCISGFSEWENIFPLEDFNSFLEIINNDMKNKNIDVSVEHSLSYNDYLKPCAAALKFLYGIPKQVIKKDFILILYKKLRNIFTYDSAKFVQKFWSDFSDSEKIEAILKLHKSLRFVQQYDAASIVINLFINIYTPRLAKRLDTCKNELIYIANYANQNQRCVTEEQLTIFKALLYFTDALKKDTASSQFENDILKYHPNVYTIIFNKQKPETRSQTKTSHDDFFDLLSPTQLINPTNTDPKKYIFTRPPTDISIPLNPADPFVKIQMKRMSREFTIDELQKILSNMIKLNDAQGIKLVLQYSFSKGLILDLTNLTFAEKSIPIVIQYLKSIKSPYLDKFISPFLSNIDNLPIQTYLSIIKVNPSLYLQKIIQSPKVKKTQMKHFASVISSAGFSSPQLIEAVTHCFVLAKSPQKLFYSLVLIQNTLQYLQEIPTDFLMKIFDLFKSRLSELNYFTSIQILYILSVKIPTEPKILEFVKQFKGLVSPSSPELYYIYVMLDSLTSGGSPAYSKEVPKVIDHLLESHFASVFITGMLLFTHAQKKLTGTRLQSLMKHGFNHILRRLTKTFKCYPIPETSTISLINILTLPVFKKSQKELIESLPKIISRPADASFSMHYLLLVQAIGLVEEKKQFDDEQILFQNMAYNLFCNTVSTSFLLRTYIKTIIARAEKMSSKPKQENFVMDNVTKFINIIQEKVDFYDMSSIILDWCSLLNMFNGFKQLLPIMSDHIFKNAQRFFPVFVGVAMFAKRFRNANQNNPEILKCLDSSFIGSGKQKMLIHRAHGMALQLLAVPGKMKIALDLASFDKDCPASDLIIQKLNSS